jgi:hypothetical protein
VTNSKKKREKTVAIAVVAVRIQLLFITLLSVVVTRLHLLIEDDGAGAVADALGQGWPAQLVLGAADARRRGIMGPASDPLNMSLPWMITPAASSAPDVVTILLFLPPPIVLSPETSPTDQRYDPLLGVKSKKKNHM